jgi:hypothetical protein
MLPGTIEIEALLMALPVGAVTENDPVAETFVAGAEVNETNADSSEIPTMFIG